MPADVADVVVLGIRHHGPGSARAVAEALDEVQPDVVLIEGAPELDAVLPLMASPDMRPPVAGLVYAPDEPKRAAFYPMAVFSPEWVAATWALRHGVEVHFTDLPAAHQLALGFRDDEKADSGRDPASVDGPAGPSRDNESVAAERREADRESGDAPDDNGGVLATPSDRRPGDPVAGDPVAGGDAGESGVGWEVDADADPISVLAGAAGFDDPERWWEDAVEHRHGGLDRFTAVMEAMAELRADGALARRHNRSNERREAAMRRTLRATMKRADKVAFVCGAWHAPALRPESFPTAKHDTDLLKGLPKVKVAATWVPWTNGRLAFRSGYGAGVASPGWYEHLFTAPDEVSTRWLARTAQLLRAEEIPTSSATVIEAVRLADALAALRERPLAGVSELTDATEAVLCAGSKVPLAIVGEKLFVGEALGAVPDETPMVPLARDLEKQQKRLRLKPSAAEQVITLDLRTETHRARSHLLHRLRLLDIPWGEQVDSGRSKGTFKESWRLQWHPELAVRLIDASGKGTTIAGAAAATVAEGVDDADIATLTELIETALLAELPEALASAMEALADRAARQRDTQRLMAAVEPLARITRYGNVRRVDTELVASVLQGIAVRVSIGLGAACTALDDDAALALRRLIDGVHRGLAMVDDAEQRTRWYTALAGVADQGGVHGTVGGRATRLLLDGGRITASDANRRLSLRLSAGAEALESAAWLDSFLSGDAALLLHDDELLDVVDDWLSDVPAALFDDLLPLVRRTFSSFSQPERRMIGQKARRLDPSAAGGRAAGGAADGSDGDARFNPERARLALPVLRQILGTAP
jgi:hypothetical protein